MKVVLLQDVKSQGKRNDIIEVSDGYARNYLIPRKLAAEADARILARIRQEEADLKRRAETEVAEAREISQRLDTLLIKIRASAGSDGKLYGAVTPKHIADELERTYGIAVDRRKIQPTEPIRAYGKYELEIRLAADIAGKLHVLVCK